MGACLSQNNQVSVDEETDKRYPKSGATSTESTSTTSPPKNKRKISPITTTKVKNPEGVASMIASTSKPDTASLPVGGTGGASDPLSTTGTTGTTGTAGTAVPASPASPDAPDALDAPKSLSTAITANNSTVASGATTPAPAGDAADAANSAAGAAAAGPRVDPITAAMKACGRDILFLDGGLGTHMKELGGDVNGALWASRLLVSDGDLIKQAHVDYLDSGSNIITSSTYQASFKGFHQMYECSHLESAKLLIKSINLMQDSIKTLDTTGAGDSSDGNESNAPEAENEVQNVQNESNNGVGGKGLESEPRVIAASIGAYGAHLCDGSEYCGYDGNIDVTEDKIREFHVRKMNAFVGRLDSDFEAKSGARQRDLKAEMKYDASKIVFACETVPCVMEVKVLTQILNEFEYFGWISMTVISDTEMSSKELIADAVEAVQKHNTKGFCIGIGVNCSSPVYMSNIIKLIRNEKKWDGHVMVYPNNGKEFDTEIGDYLDNGKEWDNEKYAKHAVEWHKLGADVIGGCCLTNPGTIKSVREAILKAKTGGSEL